MNFESLVGRINLIQDALQAQAAHAVNLSLTACRSTFRSLGYTINLAEIVRQKTKRSYFS